MKYRKLGSTGLNVSEISLGTAELGQDYGIPVPGDYGRPTKKEAVSIIKKAVEEGINFFDTAGTYGNSEQLLGEEVSKHPELHFATKVLIPENAQGNDHRMAKLRKTIMLSVASSLRRLRRDRIDLLQIHNATSRILANEEVLTILMDLRESGDVRYIGASLYGEDAAMAAIRTGIIEVIQVAFSLLDQRMASKVIPEASKQNVGIIARSAFLKGALTPKGQYLPAELESLSSHIQKIMNFAPISWEELPEFALRFCLSFSDLSTILVGARTIDELSRAMSISRKGPFLEDQVRRLRQFSLEQEEILNPSLWPIV